MFVQIQTHMTKVVPRHFQCLVIVKLRDGSQILYTYFLLFSWQKTSFNLLDLNWGSEESPTCLACNKEETIPLPLLDDSVPVMSIQSYLVND